MTNNDVRTLDWKDVLSVLEAAFRARATGSKTASKAFRMPERVAISVPQGTYLTMPCADKEGWFGVKQVSILPDNPSRNKPSVQAWYTLFDPTGTPALACDATLLTRLRTSAVSALVAKYLALESAQTLLVVGTGSLAPWQAEAHLQVRPYKQVLVWGRDFAKAKATAAEVAERAAELNVDVEAVEVLEPAFRRADVITAATTAKKPLLKGAWLRPGQHLDLVGAFIPEMAEADADTVRRADVFVDDLEACTLEAGDLIQAHAQGWSFDAVHGDLSAVVTGQATRQGRERVTLFKSVGLALEDLVIAKLLQDDLG